MKITKIEVEATDGTKGAVILDEDGPLAEQVGKGYWLVWDESDPRFNKDWYRDEFLDNYQDMLDEISSYYDETKALNDFAKPYIEEYRKSQA